MKRHGEWNLSDKKILWFEYFFEHRSKSGLGYTDKIIHNGWKLIHRSFAIGLGRMLDTT